MQRGFYIVLRPSTSHGNLQTIVYLIICHRTLNCSLLLFRFGCIHGNKDFVSCLFLFYCINIHRFLSGRHIDVTNQIALLILLRVWSVKYAALKSCAPGEFGSAKEQQFTPRPTAQRCKVNSNITTKMCHYSTTSQVGLISSFSGFFSWKSMWVGYLFSCLRRGQMHHTHLYQSVISSLDV